MPTPTDAAAAPDAKKDDNDKNVTSTEEPATSATANARPKRSAALKPLLSTQSALIQREEYDLKRAIQASLLEAKKAKARERANENGQMSDNSMSQASTSTKPPGKRAKGSGCSSASSTASLDVGRKPTQRKFAHNGHNGFPAHHTPIKTATPPKPTREVFQAIKPRPDDFLTYLCFRKVKSALPPHLDLDAINKKAMLEKSKNSTPTSNQKGVASPAMSLDNSARKKPAKTAATASVTRKLSLDSTPSKRPDVKNGKKVKKSESSLKSNPFTKNIVEKAKKFTSTANKSKSITEAKKLKMTTNKSTNNVKSSPSKPFSSPSSASDMDIKPLPTIVFPKLPENGRSMRTSTRTITLATNNFAAVRDMMTTSRSSSQSPSSFPKPAAKKQKVTNNNQPATNNNNKTKSHSAPATPAKRISRSISSTSGKSQEDIERERLKIKQLILEIERQHEMERRGRVLPKKHSKPYPSTSSSSTSSSSESDTELKHKQPTKNNAKKQLSNSSKSPVVSSNHISSSNSKQKPASNNSNSPAAAVTDNGNSRSVRSSTKTITLATNNMARAVMSRPPTSRRTTR